MKKQIITFFYIITTQVLISQTPFDCGDGLLVEINESQSSDIYLGNCAKDLLITTTDDDIEIRGLIEVNENYVTRIVPTGNHKIYLKSSYSNKTVIGKTRTSTGTDGDDGDAKQAISLYPNPTDTNLTIAIQETIISYTISDTYSIVKLQGNTPKENTIIVSSLKTGLYYLTLQTNSQIITKTFYKN